MRRLITLSSRANGFEIPRRLLLAIVLGLCANGCQPTTQTSPAQGPPALLCGGSSSRECQLTLFDVEPDDGPNPLIERFRSARTGIDFVPFMLDEPSTVQALGAARERGVKVRVLLEPAPGERPGIAATAQRALQQAGIAVRPANSSFALTHAKYAVLDGSRALVLTHNSDSAELTTRRDFALEDDDLADAQFLQSLFDADWERGALGAVPPGFVVSPGNSNEALVALVASSQSSIELYAQRLLASPLLQALAEAARRGVAVRILSAPLSSLSAALDLIVPLIQQRRLELRMPRAPLIHAKVMIVDGATAFLGSENVEDAPRLGRRELGVVFSEPAIVGQLRATFERDWTVTADSLRIPSR